MFAYVQFLEDNIRLVVPVTDIRNFSPKSTQEFDKKYPYHVLWPRKDDKLNLEKNNFKRSYHEAFILALSEKEDGFTLKRMVAPPKNLAENPSELSESDANDGMPISPILSHEEELELQQILGKRTAAISSPCPREKKARSSSSEFSSSEDEEEKLSSQKKKNKALKKKIKTVNAEKEVLKKENDRATAKIASLEEELKNIRDLNYKFQTRMFENLDCIPQRKARNPDSLSTPKRVVCGVEFEEAKIQALKSEPDVSRFVKSSLHMLYGESLAERSYSGKIRHLPAVKDGSTQTKAISPDKLAAIKVLLKEKLTEDGLEPNVIMEKMKPQLIRMAITSKCNDEQKKKKNRETSARKRLNLESPHLLDTVQLEKENSQIFEEF